MIFLFKAEKENAQLKSELAERAKQEKASSLFSDSNKCQVIRHVYVCMGVAREKPYLKFIFRPLFCKF